MKVSVIMSVYNGQEFLKEAVDSILNQTFTDFEFIITDDFSQDESVCILDEYARYDTRIILIKNNSNIGLTKNLNNMINISRGEFIARMDADDISESDRLEKQIHIFNKNKEIDFVFSNTVLIDKSSHIICRSWRPKSLSKILRLMTLVNYIPHPTVMVRAEIFKRYKYNVEYKTGQDKELWERLKVNGVSFYFVNDVLLRYRINFNSVRNKDIDMNVKYVNSCFSNNSKLSAIRFFKLISFNEKVKFLIKFIVPFRIIFFKSLFFRKFFKAK